MKMTFSAAAVLLLTSSLAFAEPHKEQAPRPGPEIQKLGYYVGTWRGHGETKGGPFGAAGKLASKMTCTWFAGGFQVVCRGEEMGPSGKRGFLNILSYDEQKKAYTEYSISSMGESEYDQNGSLIGRELTFLVDQDVRGKSAKFRYTEDHVSSVRMTYRAEVSVGGAPWSELAEGEIRRVK